MTQRRRRGVGRVHILLATACGVTAVLPACTRVGTNAAPSPPAPTVEDRTPQTDAPVRTRPAAQPETRTDPPRPANARTRETEEEEVGEPLPSTPEGMLAARDRWLRGPDEIQESAYRHHEDIQEDVEFWMNFWQGRGRSYFSRYLVRMALYQPLVDRALMAHDLPPTLRYLPIIESGYNPTAVSRVGATGLWQFMGPTARWLGLRVDGFVDERRDPFRATDTAIGYLMTLREDFGSWFLALAAYNSGPGRVSGILRRNAPDAPRGDSLFWAMSENFPTETSFFVPKLLAAAELATNPERYGFERPNPGDSLMFERVEVQGTTSLDVVAKAANSTLEEVVALNPQLVQRVTPLNTLWSVRVPPGGRDGFAERLAEVPPDERVTFVQHRVARGETLGHIAQRYGIRLSNLRAANPGVRPQRLQIGQRLIIPQGPSSSTQRLASASSAEPADAMRASSTRAGGGAGESGEREGGGSEGSTTHVVRSGESPWTISRQYGVSVDQLLAWNSLSRGAVLYPGDEIVVRGVAATAVASAPQSTEYRVRSGDTLSEIAERHGVSTRELLRHNGLSSRSVIKPGQTIRIPAPS